MKIQTTRSFPDGGYVRQNETKNDDICFDFEREITIFSLHCQFRSQFGDFTNFWKQTITIRFSTTSVFSYIDL